MGLLSVLMWLCAACVLALLVALARLKYRFSHPPININFYPPHPILGNTNIVGEDLSQCMETLYHKYADEKSGIFGFWLFSSLGVVLTKPEHVHKALMSSVYREGIYIPELHNKMFFGQYSLIVLRPQEWEVHRKIMSKAFNSARLNLMTNDLVQITMNGVRYLSECHANQSIKGQVNLLDVIKLMTLDAITKTVFGFDCQCIDYMRQKSEYSPVGRAFDFLLAENSRRLYSANPLDHTYWMPTQANIKHAQSRKIVTDQVIKMIKSKMALLQQPSSSDIHEDFLTHMMRSVDESTGSKFTEEDLVDEVITLMFAGYDSTAITCTMAIYLLCKNPRVMEKLQNEIDQVLGTRPPTPDDISRLVYAQNVFKETLRIYPVAPLTSRNLEVDLTLDGVTLPAKTFVWIPIKLIQNMESIWPNPTAFIPERFENDPAPGTYMPFSAGRRICLGHRFASLEGPLIIACLVQHLNFSLCAASENVRMKQIGPVLSPDGGLLVKVTPRHQSSL